MKRVKWIVGALLIGLVCGCAVLPTKTVRSYELNKEVTATVGSVMIGVETFVQACDAEYGWRINAYNKSKAELLYNGRSGDIIEITYREYAQDYARPAFFQNVKYDLSSSDIIVFRGTTIKVLEASNTQIRFMVTNDPTTAKPKPE